MFAISMLEGYNVLEFSPRIKNTVIDLEESLPAGILLNIATFQADAVETTINNVSSSVLQTLAIVLAIVIWFLGLRTGLIVGTIVPFVMLTTLAFMQIFSMELERMSLATLIISLGLLVDSGIVIAEDFKRRIEEGIGRADALKNCGEEMAIPLLISALTTVLVFLPLLLAQHQAREYTRSISLVIMISLLTSWVLALCITPTLCYFSLKKADASELNNTGKLTLIEKLVEPYERLLHWVLCYRKTFLSLMVLAFFGSLVLLGAVPQQFFPDSDRTQVLAYVELPPSEIGRAHV